MSQKGYLLKAVYPLVMPENYILMPKVMPLSTPEEEKKILIILSDGRPYDVIINRPNAKNPAPYQG